MPGDTFRPDGRQPGTYTAQRENPCEGGIPGIVDEKSPLHQ